MNYKGMGQTAKLRELLRRDGLIVAAGAHDAMSARIIEQVGFPVCLTSGAGISMCRGYADFGLMSLEEVVSACRYIADAVDIPVIADGDNGYGNALGVMRTVRLFEQAGVAGLSIEDQAMPKRCGHMSGKTLISKEEMVQKIRAARDACRDPDFVILARCDALIVTGLQDTLDRGDAYATAGADILWCEVASDMGKIEAIARHFRGRIPLHYNHSSSPMVPKLSLAEYERLGFKTVGYHAQAAHVAAMSMREVLAEIRKTGNTLSVLGRIGDFEDYYNIGHLRELRELEKKYAV
ncbi:MAG: isocitrate lyase/PEP mutase family protein [Betaproteobacteria bacterium]|nr:isocitrate lyase/PEP mutase family protein [Betaproteobacteria bacterium]